ncbi:MAG: adenosylcobinamide-GDP ribazoletransferase [Deltaproteobacteria bacterium]|jgi:adenosylcobinamide-GDP ribazoletransferase|nr:adenosylcobinamide-GDP ribazoletransferase [Deltaproteobacteria bacterium]
MRFITEILNCLAYMTILPLSGGRRMSEKDFGRLPAYFPVAGLVLGLILFVFFKLLEVCGTPPAVSAILLSTVLIIFTRGFHLDGLADTMDALLSHKSREEKLAIMKDPHQGTFGVLSIVLDILLRVTLLTEILKSPDFAAPLILFPVWGRLTSSTVSAFSRYARPSGGLAQASVERSGFREFLLAFGLTAAFSLLFGFYPFLMALITFLLAIVLVWVWDKLMGGITGDLLGASLEITEVTTLFLYVLLFL